MRFPKIIVRLYEYCLDFLFPKDEALTYIESLSPEDILNNLPRASINNDKDTLILFDYKDKMVKRMIWELKYKGNRVIARKLGQIFHDLMLEELAERTEFESSVWQKSIPLLVPIPTSRKRRRERGWNPTELITQEIEKIDQNKNFIHSPDVLKKTRHTESQARTHATREERIKNLDNSMQANEKRTRGRCVILVDDVTTSGATFREAERTLRNAGAKRIIRFAAAR
jgi:ComF family protein